MYLVYSSTFYMKKTGDYFLVYSATFLIRKICVQNKRGPLFSLLSYFYNTKDLCFKKVAAAV